MDRDLRCGVVSLLSWLFLASSARAANDDGVPIGTQAAQTAAAVTAVSDGAASTFYNPAGLASGEEASLDATLTAYGLRIIRVDDVLQGPEDSADTRYTEWVLVPSLVGHVMKLRGSWKLGLIAAVPTAQDYAVTLSLKTPEGVNWQLIQEERSETLNVGPGVGFRAAKNLRVGFSLLGVYESDRLLVSAFAGNPDMPGRSVSALVVQNTREWGIDLRAGVQWDVHPAWTMGLSLIGPTIVFARTVEDSGSLLNASGGTTSASQVQTFDRSSDTQALLDASGSPQIRGGAAYHYARGYVSADASLYFPLDLPSVTASGDRKLAYNLRAGMRHDFSESLQLGAGFFTDRNLTKDANPDFYGVTLGGALTTNIALARGGTLRMHTSLSLRYALGIGHVSGAGVPTLTDPSDTLTFDSVSSRAVVNELAVSVGSGIRY